MGRGSNRESKNAIPAASWPESAPLKYEEKVISIVCARPNLHWAMHEGTEHGFAPVLFWRTPPLSTEEKQDEACTVLARHLPQQGHELIFGSDDAAPSKAVANSVAASKRIPALTVYVISNDNEDDESLKFLFKDVPNRMFKLKFSEFVDEASEGDNQMNDISSARAASLAAVSDLYKNLPILVFDAGHNLSYTAMNAKGKLLGGGIGPGINCRFRAFHDYSRSGMPRVSFDEYKKIIQTSLEDEEPLQIFSRDAKKQFMADTFCEIAGKCRSVVKHFLAQVKKEKEENGANGGTNDMDVNDAGGQPDLPVVVVTGADCGLIEKCLKPHHASLIPEEPGTGIPSEEFSMVLMKHLPHYGIAHILKGQATKAQEALENDEAFRIRSELIGNRVAKQFGVADTDGDYTYRGSIVSIKVGPLGPDDKALEKDWFFVRFDDGDKEHMDIVGLYDALELYKKVGEKDVTVDAAKTVDQKKKTEESFELKKKASTEAADSILKQSVIVQEEQKRRAESKTRGVAAPISQNRPSDIVTAQKRPYSERGNSPVAKKVKKNNIPAPKRAPVDPNKYLKSRIAKEFDQEDDDGNLFQEIFYGTIDGFVGTANSPLWHVRYDDDDEEDFDEKDIKKALKLYESTRGGDEKAVKNQSKEATGGAASSETAEKAASKEDPMDVEASKDDNDGGGKPPAKPSPVTASAIEPEIIAVDDDNDDGGGKPPAEPTTEAAPAAASAPQSAAQPQEG